jgi:adenosine deaminase
VGRRGQAIGIGVEGGAGSIEVRERHAHLGRHGVGPEDTVGRLRQGLGRIPVAGDHSRRAGRRGVDRGQELGLEPGDARERPIGGVDDRGIRGPRQLRAWSAAAEDDRECHEGRGGENAAAYHGRMDRDEIRRLPKSELHQHLDGSVRPATAVELAGAIGMSLTLDEATGRMVGPARCADQAELLTFFDLPIALLQTAEALERAAAELVEDLAADGIRYAEIRWAPRLHLERGLSVPDVIGAVIAGVTRAAAAPDAPVIGLIVTAMRSHPPAANAELARTAGGIGAPLVGFDLAGPEAAWPAPPHAIAFVAAREAGLALTAHAGEVAGPERVREVLEFGVRRVAHGVTAIDDPALINLLRDRDVTLDLCPTSNVQAGVVDSLESHPLAALHRAGVSVTISTDDLTVTGTSLSEELVRCADAFSLSTGELTDIVLNSFARAFAPQAVMAPLVAEAASAWHAWSRATIS